MSSSNLPYNDGFDSFTTYVQEHEHQKQLLLLSRSDCLLDYIDSWIWAGLGVQACYGDFHIFLSTVAVIIDEWYKTPDLLDFRGDPEIGQPHEVIERRVSSVFPEGKHTHRVFDPHNFTAACFHYRLEAIEAGIEHFYGTFQLRPEDVDRLRGVVRRELRAERQRAEDDAARAAKTLQRTKDQQAKLLEAHYQGAVPLDLLKVEMDRLTRERANAETELRLATTTLVELDSQLERILIVAGNCQAQYQAAAKYPAIRRQINQGLFVKLFISQDGGVERAELTEPFASLLTGDQVSPPVITMADGPTPTTSQIAQNAPADDGSVDDAAGRLDTPRVDLGDRSRPSVVLLRRLGTSETPNLPK